MLFKSLVRLFLAATMSMPACAFADDLLQIFNLAVDNDPQVRQAREQYNSNHTLLTQGRSQLLPSMNLQARSARNTNAPSEIHSYGQGFNSHSYSLTLSQNLLNMEAWYAFQAARESDRQALSVMAQAEQELILRVATAYFNVLRSIDNLATREAEEEAALRTFDQSQQRFDVGLTAITDVNQSQASYDLARVNRLLEENNLSQSYEALAVLTGRAHTSLEALSAEFPIEGADPTDMEDWVELALENNLAIRIAEFAFEASKDTVRSRRSAHLPTLSLSAGYDDFAESANPFSFFPNTAAERSNITLTLNVPLYSGGLDSARRRQAYYDRNVREEALMLAQRTNTQTTRNFYRSVQTDVLTVAARQQAIVSAQSALEATELGVDVGTQNIVDLVVSQRALYQALRDYANARYDYVIDTLNLKQAAGTLNPGDVMELNEWLE